MGVFIRGRHGGTFNAGIKRFVPTDISGCILWLPGSAYNLSGGTLTGTDQSGNGNNCVQATGANQPTIVAGSPTYLSFTPNQWLEGTITIAADAPITCCVLTRAPTGADGVVWTTSFAPFFGGNVMQELGGNRWYQYGTNHAAYTEGATIDVQNTATSFFGTGGTVIIYKNGVSKNSSGSNHADAATKYRVGADFSGINGWSGRIYEIIVYNSVLSASNQAKVEAYQMAEVGL